MTDKQAHFKTGQVPGVGAPSHVTPKLGGGESTISILRHPLTAAQKGATAAWVFSKPIDLADSWDKTFLEPNYSDFYSDVLMGFSR